jgi:twitching motility protein PilT
VASALRAVFAQQLCRCPNGGRTAACEIMFATPALMTLLQQGRLDELSAALSTARELGMQTLNDHLVELVQGGRVAAAEAYLRTYDRFELGQRLQEEDAAHQSKH